MVVSSGFGSAFGSAALVAEAAGAELAPPVEAPPQAAIRSAAAMVVASQLNRFDIYPHLFRRRLPGGSDRSRM
jgi:hypothetical protein